MDMSNYQMKLSVDLEMVNGNVNKNSIPLKARFLTKYDNGKIGFFNRGRAIQKLIYFLIDNNFATPGEIVIDSLNYDRAERKINKKIEGEIITIGNSVNFSIGNENVF